jgi:hypothetical protein
MDEMDQELLRKLLRIITQQEVEDACVILVKNGVRGESVTAQLLVDLVDWKRGTKA